MTFDKLFKQATGNSPYPYQRRLATAPELAELVRVPTGAGKTAGAVLAWLWRRFYAEDKVRRATPRRLVYCLPMRVLVEQSIREAEKWLRELKHDRTKISVLMGGAESDDWYLEPERSAILIGTQDMLLSRALNRGYAASRFHWPIDFGLLNNDCLWVFDEPQLMGNGVSTSAQLAGLRAALGMVAPCSSLWMSATLEPSWLDTVDFAKQPRGPSLELQSDDFDPKWPLNQRMTAEKTLQPLGIMATRDGKDVAQQVVKNHLTGTQTLVVLNTVDRAKEVYKSIKKDKSAPTNVLLVHSRFRQSDRKRLNEELMEPAKDRIIVATQVVEAGVDISVQTLITELAPWSSLVQRIGRCNRTGVDGPGRVFWIDLDSDKLGAPYEPPALRFAREQLVKLIGQDVSPKALDVFKNHESITLDFVPTHVLRRRDLLDLFDTTPDLSGNDIDVAPYIRGDEKDSDVQVYWRKVGSPFPEKDAKVPNRLELCRVPIGAFRTFLRKEKKGKRPAAYLWDHLDGAWRQIRESEREVHPGMTVLLPAVAGGYSTKLGWDEDSSEAVEPVELDDEERPLEEAVGDDLNSCGPEYTIAEHTEHVCSQLDEFLSGLGDLPDGWSAHLRRAARWHDLGKAHDVFQGGVRKANPSLDSQKLWAKSGRSGRLSYDRPHFRHELASALAALQHGLPFEVVYLIAAHHGKVRLSIRSLPDERPPDQPGRLFAQGVHDGDTLTDVDLGDEKCPGLKLDLSPMQLGGATSWTAQALALRDAIGPFRLAYMEALLRSADLLASKEERKGWKA
ncbi:CRISPR-associated endonuclease/helicase Cas3 [Singulisphaera sp. GP187]|uniref:type I-G CRISPR-associated helicase/endonuclease Cas3g n=1 Tax=Singulisphaera sp. GP187 TaxID=1882752 RepID=UPI0009293C49|nr:CRISPR-associated helicase Cas3' [Singulisphaera sp. GP187]SIO61241.1 CRISPR-associated endonuclease/helicase Cas3 [Singulisphaera sp. GP187]